MPSHPIATWITPCNSRNVLVLGTSTRRHTIGLIPSSQTLTCTISAALASAADEAGSTLALRLTHIPAGVKEDVFFRAHEVGTGRRHARCQASRQARWRELSTARADLGEQASTGPISPGKGGDRGRDLRAGSQRLGDRATAQPQPRPAVYLASAGQEGTPRSSRQCHV